MEEQIPPTLQDNAVVQITDQSEVLDLMEEMSHGVWSLSAQASAALTALPSRF